jgi:hypothetical protein
LLGEECAGKLIAFEKLMGDALGRIGLARHSTTILADEVDCSPLITAQSR